MIAPDVNILLYALREESDRHAEYRSWLESVINGSEPVALFEPVQAALLRIATHTAIYRTPTPRTRAESFLRTAISSPAAASLRAGEHHWDIFLDLCHRADCRGNLITDAYFAALALEHGCLWITADRDFSRFRGLSWKHPLDHPAVKRNPG